MLGRGRPGIGGCGPTCSPERHGGLRRLGDYARLVLGLLSCSEVEDVAHAMSNSSELVTIYVELLGEGVQVWRPVKARHVHENRYEIVAQDYDRDAEHWRFGPGATVVCQAIQGDDGPFLAAVRAMEAGAGIGAAKQGTD